MSRFFVRVRPTRGAAAALLCALTMLAGSATASAAPTAGASVARRVASTDVTGRVTDSTSGAALSNVEIAIMRNGALVANTATDEFGRFTIHNLDAGNYVISAHYIGFAPAIRQLTITGGEGEARVDFKLVAAVVNLAAIEVKR